MSVLKQFRKAVFGETWELPILVASLLGAAEVLKAVLPGAWPHIGGPFLIVAVIALLSVLVFRSSRTSQVLCSGGVQAPAGSLKT